MKLSEAVEDYVTQRRSEGAQFISTELILKSLCKRCGDISISELSANRIASFLAPGRVSPATFASKLSAVKCFVVNAVARDLMTMPYLPRPTKKKTRRLPYIYTRNQLRELLASARARCVALDSFSGETLRMILLLLYATGAGFEEILSLRRSDVDMRVRRLNFRKGYRRPSRSLPVGADLLSEVSQYLDKTRNRAERDGLLLPCKDGRPIQMNNLWYRFSKLHRTAGLAKTVEGYEPRLLDLKFTFAVHRLSNCIRNREKLNLILPALSAYLGYTSLIKAEEFLAFVPERFSEDLRKLSPAQVKTHWRDVPNLLESLHAF
jgi:integrase/recombinase XerD